MIQIVGAGAHFEELYYVSSEKCGPFRRSFCIPISSRVALLVVSGPNSRDKNASELSKMELGGAPNGERCGRGGISLISKKPRRIRELNYIPVESIFIVVSMEKPRLHSSEAICAGRNLIGKESTVSVTI